MQPVSVDPFPLVNGSKAWIRKLVEVGEFSDRANTIVTFRTALCNHLVGMKLVSTAITIHLQGWGKFISFAQAIHSKF